MLPDEEAEELVLRVHFYGIRSSRGLCMAAVKKMVAFARERGLNTIAKVLESAYVDDCNSSVTTLEELEEIKQEMPRFMSEYGFPIKALAWSGEDAPEELTDNGFINTTGYIWEPKSDTMKIMTPKIFHGEKKKGRFTQDTQFYKDKKITHATILSETASLYDSIGFAAPLKVYGSYICRRALIESAGDPMKEVEEETRKLFLQYTYQVKMLETLTFSRNKYMLGRSEDDILILCTDASFNTSMMIL